MASVPPFTWKRALPPLSGNLGGAPERGGETLGLLGLRVLLRKMGNESPSVTGRWHYPRPQGQPVF